MQAEVECPASPVLSGEARAVEQPEAGGRQTTHIEHDDSGDTSGDEADSHSTVSSGKDDDDDAESTVRVTAAHPFTPPHPHTTTPHSPTRLSPSLSSLSTTTTRAGRTSSCLSTPSTPLSSPPRSDLHDPFAPSLAQRFCAAATRQARLTRPQFTLPHACVSLVLQL